MANAEILKKYLVDENNGYLLDNNNNGKVIMLSGKWGSGKTHFWQKQIQTVLENKDKKIPNHYVSLYGKTSIQEIKNEIFLKVFESVDSYEVIEKGKALAKNTVDLISLFTKSVGIDLSKMTDKPFEKLENVLDDKKLKKTIEYLNSGAIICFDDFERKSKDIDLNDLFGFITQLTLNFDCKVVIILNDDVFDGEEKKIFSNVKEKSVSKFLKYEPSIKELFETIFNSDKRYRVLDKHKEIILNTIEETEELNARIYIQVLDNLVEWIKNQDKSDNVLRCLILVNINFILNHKIVITSTKENRNLVDGKRYKSKSFNIKEFEKETLYSELFEIIDKKQYPKESIIENLVQNELEKHSEHYVQSIVENRKNFIKENRINIYAISFASIHNFDENVSSDQLIKINNFIETGILINE